MRPATQDALVKLFQPDNREFWGHEKAANVLWPKVALGLEKTILSFVPFFPLRRVDVRACLKGEVCVCVCALYLFVAV